MNGREVVLATLLFAATVFSTAAQPQEARFPLAESAAREYMTAFLQSDIPVAASLTHPDTLERMRAQLLKGLSGSVTPADLNLSLSLDEIRGLSAEELYIAFVEADRNRTPAATAAMRDARAEVISSREAPDGGVIVQLRLLTPSGNDGTYVQVAELLVRSSENGWKVVGDDTQR